MDFCSASCCAGSRTFSGCCAKIFAHGSAHDAKISTMRAARSSKLTAFGGRACSAVSTAAFSF